MKIARMICLGLRLYLMTAEGLHEMGHEEVTKVELATEVIDFDHQRSPKH